MNIFSSCANGQIAPVRYAGLGFDLRTRTLTKVRIWLVAVALCCLSGHCLLAQIRSGGEIAGLLTDSSGAVMPSATVKIENQSAGVTISVQTSASGNYDAPFLPTGVYSVTVSGGDFKTFERPDITVDVGQTVRIDTSLIVGQASEQVTVTAAEPEMQRDCSQVDLTLPSELVESLPMVNRDVSTAETFAPGTSMAQTQQNGGSTIKGYKPADIGPGFARDAEWGTILSFSAERYR